MKELTDKDFLELLDTVGLGGNNEYAERAALMKAKPMDHELEAKRVRGQIKIKEITSAYIRRS